MAASKRTSSPKQPNLLADFPCSECVQGCSAEGEIQDLFRLLTTDLTHSQFLNGAAARRLVGTMLRSYQQSQASPRWQTDEFLARLGSTGGTRFQKVLSAIFDFATNVEYCTTRLNRITSSKWIYCNADPAKGRAARVFYSFLKQCPSCCLSVGLGARIEGAQHKPASHHIGEITGCLMGMVLVPVLASHSPPITYAMVTKQSHSVDAVAFSKDLAVLLEIKASPLVTLPVAADLVRPMMKDDADVGAKEYTNHQLVDFQYESAELYFLIPHRDVRIPLGSSLSPDWPYIPASKFMADPEGLLTYLSSWAELYEAFAVPKTERTGRIETVAYLTNGWGDEIDSNKTKPGLGRTDDLKKGTYQLLKYGVYYKDRCKRQALYSALLANLDPVNLWAAYLEKLIDVRWTKEEYVQKQADYFKVAVDRLYYLYEAVVALNRPVINEPTLKGVFDFERGHQAVVSGALNSQILDPWIS